MALTDNLLAHWKLNEAVNNDRLDSVNSYTMLESLDYVESTAGVIGIAARMIAAQALASFLNHIIVDPATFGPTTAFTAAGWVRITSTYADSGDYMAVYVIEDFDNFKFPISLEVDYITDGPYPIVWSNLSDGTAVSKQHTTKLDKDTWYFLACRWTGSQLGISVNGGAFQETEQVSLWQPGSYGDTRTASIGARDHLGCAHDVDSVSYWRNRALSESEINQLYNGGAGLDYPFSAATVPIECVLADDLTKVIVQEA